MALTYRVADPRGLRLDAPLVRHDQPRVAADIAAGHHRAPHHLRGNTLTAGRLRKDLHHRLVRRLHARTTYARSITSIADILLDAMRSSDMVPPWKTCAPVSGLIKNSMAMFCMIARKPSYEAKGRTLKSAT